MRLTSVAFAMRCSSRVFNSLNAKGTISKLSSEELFQQLSQHVSKFEGIETNDRQYLME